MMNKPKGKNGIVEQTNTLIRSVLGFNDQNSDTPLSKEQITLEDVFQMPTHSIRHRVFVSRIIRYFKEETNQEICAFPLELSDGFRIESFQHAIEIERGDNKPVYDAYITDQIKWIGGNNPLKHLFDDTIRRCSAPLSKTTQGGFFMTFPRKNRSKKMGRLFAY